MKTFELGQKVRYTKKFLKSIRVSPRGKYSSPWLSEGTVLGIGELENSVLVEWVGEEEPRIVRCSNLESTSPRVLVDDHPNHEYDKVYGLQSNGIKSGLGRYNGKVNKNG